MNGAYGLLVKDDPLELTFAGQFSGEGQNVTYRYSGIGAPLTFTAQERDSFVDDYGRKLRTNIWLFWAFLLLSVSALLYFSTAETGVTWTIIVVVFFVSIGYTRLRILRLWQGPEYARLGQSSPQLSESRAKARTAFVEAQPWWSIIVWLFVALLQLSNYFRSPAMEPWDIFAGVMFTGLFLVNARYAILKLQARRQPLTP